MQKQLIPYAVQDQEMALYNTALEQRGSLSIWFDPEMSRHAPPTGTRRLQPEFSDAAIQVCLTMKVRSACPSRKLPGSSKASFA